MFKVTVKTQQQCINITILFWQYVSVLLDHLHIYNIYIIYFHPNQYKFYNYLSN